MAKSDFSDRLKANLRTLTWLDAARVRVYAAMVLVAYIPMMVKVFREATGTVGSDFLAFWGTGRLLLSGPAPRVYDLAAEHAAQMAAGTGQMVAYVNPPPFLFLAAPLGLMPYAVAWVVWALAGWAIWFLVARRALPDTGGTRDWAGTLAVLAFPAAYLAASHAQNGFITGAILIAAVLTLRRSQALSGALFGLLVIKPHLALLVPFWLAAGRKWTAIAAAAASAALLCLASLTVFGLDTWRAYPQSFEVSQILMSQTSGEFFLRMCTPYAALHVLFGPTAAMAGQAAITLVTGALACLYWRRAPSDEAAGAMLLAATALASPYLFSYDLPFLAMPVFFLIGMGRSMGWRPWEKSLLVLIWLAPLATRAAALPLGLNLMPLAAAVLFWLVWSTWLPAKKSPSLSEFDSAFID
ncbi:glycosyltransferase family 87 protein [Novosphingobium sp.]|uniref:glycosyltransferase family 87 protein n=1 Tax=Novosphingobium sp. TaxID=1874826 RepID=UPI003BA889BA